MDAAQFSSGLTYDQFKDGMTKNRERLETNEAAVVLDERDLAYFRSLKPLHCVAIVSEGSGDVGQNLPVVAVLAREVGPTLDFRCFIKTDHPDLMAAYLNRGKFESTPVFAFFDEEWRDVGALIERPWSVTERREEDRIAVHAENPEFGSPDEPPSNLSEELQAAILVATRARRATWKPWADRQLILAIRDCIARAPEVGEPVPHTPR